MQCLPGFTDFFMSPVTGRKLLSALPDLPDDYIWIGDPNDRPIISPIIIDLRLEIIDLRRRLSETRFILQAPSENFDDSQALNQLDPGILKHTDGVISIAIPGTDYQPAGDYLTTALPWKQVFIGNEDNVATPYDQILESNLPDLPQYQIWIGDENNKAVPRSRIYHDNLPSYTPLDWKKIWKMDITGTPQLSDDIINIELEIGDINLNFDLFKNLFDEFKIEIEIEIGDINIKLGDIDIELGDINIELGDINTELGDINVELGDINTELGDITSDISSILETITNIQTEITAINEVISTIIVDFPDLEAEVAALASAVAALTADLAALTSAVAALGATVDALGLAVAANTANIAVLDASVATLFSDVELLNGTVAGLSASLAALTAAVALINATSIELTGNVTGSATIAELSLGGTIETTLNMTLDTIPAPVDNVDMNGKQINNLIMSEDPAPTDAVNVQFITTSVIDGALGLIVAHLEVHDGEILALQAWQAVETGYMTTVQDQIVTLFGLLGDATVTLTGDVTGSGTTGVPFATTLNMTLDTIPAPIADVSLNSQKIINLATPTTGTDAANKDFVLSAIAAGTIGLTGDVTGSGLVGTPFATTLNMTLDTIPIPVANVSLNSHKITSLATPVAGTDAANKDFVLNAVAAGTITLTGNVTGSGFVGTPFATTLNMTLDTIPAPVGNLSLNSHKITNLSGPVAGTDAANKDFVLTAIAAGTITLTGNVTGSGTVGTPFATTLNMTLDTIPAPVANLSLNSHKITSLAPPTAGTDGANKDFVLSAIAASTITLTGDISGSGFVGTPFSTTLSNSITRTSSSQNFLFTGNQTATFRLNNDYALPLNGDFSKTIQEFRNSDLSGVRWVHHSSNVFGSITNQLKLNAFNSTGGEFDLLVVSSVPNSISFFAPTFFTGDITINSGSFSVLCGSHRLEQVGTPINLTDAANRGYVDTRTITLTGDVSGSGTLGTPFATTLNTNISVAGSHNSQTFTFNDLSSEFAIVNSYVPTVGSPSVTSSYLKNSGGNGYRFRQVTTSGGTLAGDFFLDKVVGVSSTNLMQFDNTANSFTFVPNTNFSSTVFCNGATTPLKFPNSVLNRKIVLYESAANDHQYYGVGVNASTLRYQVDSTASDHVFYAGASSSSSNEVGRITGAGNFIIPGTSYSTVPHCSIIMTNNATGFTANNTWVKMTGVTTLRSANDFSMSANNRITYTGTTQSVIKAIVFATISWSYNSGSSNVIYFGIVKNGTPAIYYLPVTNMGTNVYQMTTLITEVNFATNDYVEIWGQSTGTNTITPWGMSLTAVRV